MCSTRLNKKVTGNYLETNPTTQLLADATERRAQLQHRRRDVSSGLAFPLCSPGTKQSVYTPGNH